MKARSRGARWTGAPDNRRGFLRAALGIGAGTVLVGRGSGGDVPPMDPGCGDPFVGGELLETLGFEGEGPVPLDQPLDAGLDGRLYTDLSRLAADSPVISNPRFFIRTRYPDRLKPSGPWLIQAGGLVKQPATLRLADLMPRVRSWVFTCSSALAMGAGLLWPAQRLPLVRNSDERGACPARSSARGHPGARLRVRRHSRASTSSIAGASWIFTVDQLTRTGAFLATHMSGVPLPLDHGAPVRLLVPGWYGCACIKWINEIRLVGEDEPATSQMQEFASRTHQKGVPALARDYRPASLDQTAMPVRIEKWRLARGRGVLYRVVGISWGGYQTTDRLTLRFNANEPFVPVKVCPPHRQNATWTFWSHPWRPAATGIYTLRLRIDDVRIPQYRLDSGFYDRTVAIAQV